MNLVRWWSGDFVTAKWPGQTKVYTNQNRIAPSWARILAFNHSGIHLWSESNISYASILQRVLAFSSGPFKRLFLTRSRLDWRLTRLRNSYAHSKYHFLSYLPNVQIRLIILRFLNFENTSRQIIPPSSSFRSKVSIDWISIKDIQSPRGGKILWISPLKWNWRFNFVVVILVIFEPFTRQTEGRTWIASCIACGISLVLFWRNEPFLKQILSHYCRTYVRTT